MNRRECRHRRCRETHESHRRPDLVEDRGCSGLIERGGEKIIGGVRLQRVEKRSGNGTLRRSRETNVRAEVIRIGVSRGHRNGVRGHRNGIAPVAPAHRGRTLVHRAKRLGIRGRNGRQRRGRTQRQPGPRRARVADDAHREVIGRVRRESGKIGRRCAFGTRAPQHIPGISVLKTRLGGQHGLVKRPGAVAVGVPRCGDRGFRHGGESGDSARCVVRHSDRVAEHQEGRFDAVPVPGLHAEIIGGIGEQSDHVGRGGNAPVIVSDVRSREIGGRRRLSPVLRPIRVAVVGPSQARRTEIHLGDGGSERRRGERRGRAEVDVVRRRRVVDGRGAEPIGGVQFQRNPVYADGKRRDGDVDRGGTEQNARTVEVRRRRLQAVALRRVLDRRRGQADPGGGDRPALNVEKPIRQRGQRLGQSRFPLQAHPRRGADIDGVDCRVVGRICRKTLHGCVVDVAGRRRGEDAPAEVLRGRHKHAIKHSGIVDRIDRRRPDMGDA